MIKKSENMKRIRRYIIVFEQIHNPGDDILDIQIVKLEMYAENITDALNLAWKTVTLDPDKYEIVMAKDVNSRCGRRSTPIECYDGEPF